MNIKKIQELMQVHEMICQQIDELKEINERAPHHLIEITFNVVPPESVPKMTSRETGFLSHLNLFSWEVIETSEKKEIRTASIKLSEAGVYEISSLILKNLIKYKNNVEDHIKSQSNDR